LTGDLSFLKGEDLYGTGGALTDLFGAYVGPLPRFEAGVNDATYLSPDLDLDLVALKGEEVTPALIV
jgi:hypothetical protein